MKLSVDIPYLAVGIPKGSRKTKCVWMLQNIEFDIPVYTDNEIMTAVEWTQRDGHTDQKKVYRVGEVHFEERHVPYHIRGDRERATLMADIGNFITDMARGFAADWKLKNLGFNFEEFPVELRTPATVAELKSLMSSLAHSVDVRLQSEDAAIGEAFRAAMGDFLAGMIIVDGVLYRECPEPVYAVHSFPGGTVIRIETSEWNGKNHIGLFPIGSYEEAREFAIANTRDGENYTDNLGDHFDCGVPLRSDTEYLSVILAARDVRNNYVSKYSSRWGDCAAASNVMELINEVPLESIATYRKVQALVGEYEKGNPVDADIVAEALRQAATDPLAHVFTDDGRIPLMAIADLWDGRDVSLRFDAPTHMP
jgi:alkylated DNA nucleotide flippase Atl1